MRILDKTYDWSGLIMTNSPSVIEGIEKKIGELHKEGFTHLLGRQNSYGFPRYVYALTEGDPQDEEYIKSLAFKEDEAAGFKIYKMERR